MELHQIQLNYLQDEDRLLCRTSFRDADGGLQEIRAWLTRYMVIKLWEGIVQALEKKVALEVPQAAHASKDIVGMEHQSSVAKSREQGSFDNPYQANAQAFPLGEKPLLITALTFNLQAGQPIRINLAPAAGYGFEIALAQPVLHGFCSVLLKTVQQANWGLDLAMPGTATQSAAPSLLN